MLMCECFDQERNADDDFCTGAHSGHESVYAEFEWRVRNTLQPGKGAEDQDAQCKRPNPADVIGHNAKDESAESPAEQADHAKQPAEPANLCKICLCTEQFGQRGPEHIGE